MLITSAALVEVVCETATKKSRWYYTKEIDDVRNVMSDVIGRFTTPVGDRLLGRVARARC